MQELHMRRREPKVAKDKLASNSQTRRFCYKAMPASHPWLHSTLCLFMQSPRRASSYPSCNFSAASSGIYRRGWQSWTASDPSGWLCVANEISQSMCDMRCRSENFRFWYYAAVGKQASGTISTAQRILVLHGRLLKWRKVGLKRC